jgi:hypothetical protein
LRFFNRKRKSAKKRKRATRGKKRDQKTMSSEGMWVPTANGGKTFVLVEGNGVWIPKPGVAMALGFRNQRGLENVMCLSAAEADCRGDDFTLAK